MNAVQRFAGLFQNSPTFGRDRANLISSFTIGTTAIALNAAILIMVLPLMLDPNDPDFRVLTQNIEFGQLLGLILMGGAAAFATLLIPMRIGTVFMGPRIGRYFDQIVLSGISPLRFLIGKVTSQNLFLALALFLLLPWFVLVLALGGLEGPVFLGNLILVWLYCMMLAMVMLWLSLYVNEILAMLFLMYVAAGVCVLGSLPISVFSVQPFVVTPFPALMHSVYQAVEAADIDRSQSYLSVFVSCALGMSAVTGMALAGIALGPLYGIVRDNSTFGEVVRAGDSKRKRRFRIRHHIQRPSEIAFFYENRGDKFRRHEVLVRWGGPLVFLWLPAFGVWWLFVSSSLVSFPARTAGPQWWINEFHVICHVIHSLGLVVAVFLFSHAKNTTYLRLPMMFGWRPTVALLDWIGFLLFLCLSTAAAIGIPLAFDFVIAQAGSTVFPDRKYVTEGESMDYLRLSIEGTLALSVASVTVYLLQRTICLNMWLKTAAMLAVTAIYGGFVCVVPAVVGIFSFEMLNAPETAFLYEVSMPVAAMSPFIVLMNLYKESPHAWHEVSSLPFYLYHFVIAAVCAAVMWYRSRTLLREYRTDPVQEVRT